ncbi:hypothetical protein JCM5350_001878 [Sporobolomyces pararoseus]
MQELPGRGNDMLQCLTSNGGYKFAGPRPIKYYLGKYDEPQACSPKNEFTVGATGDTWTAIYSNRSSERKSQWKVDLSTIPKHTRVPKSFLVVFTVPVTPFIPQSRSVVASETVA